MYFSTHTDTCIFHDPFGRAYALCGPFGPGHDTPIAPETFWDDMLTLQFLRSLECPVDNWRNLISNYVYANHPSDDGILSLVSRLLIQGEIRFYPVKYADRYRRPSPIFELADGRYCRFEDASVRLVGETGDIVSFNSKHEVTEYLASLDADSFVQNEACLKRSVGLEFVGDQHDLLEHLTELIVEAQLVVVVFQAKVASEGYSSNFDDHDLNRVENGERIEVGGGNDGNVIHSHPFRYTSLRELDSDYIGEETGVIWGSKVKYLNVEERALYQLHIQEGRLVDAEGALFDTMNARSTMGRTERAMFVMDEFGNIYASNEQYIGQFHHSSLLEGKPVASAGEISVEQGIITTISRRSGHYRPTVGHLNQFLDRLNKGGIDLSFVVIEEGV